MANLIFEGAILIVCTLSNSGKGKSGNTNANMNNKKVL